MKKGHECRKEDVLVNSNDFDTVSSTDEEFSSPCASLRERDFLPCGVGENFVTEPYEYTIFDINPYEICSHDGIIRMSEEVKKQPCSDNAFMNIAVKFEDSE